MSETMFGCTAITDKYLVRAHGVDSDDFRITTLQVNDFGSYLLECIRKAVPESEKPMTDYGAPDCTRGN